MRWLLITFVLLGIAGLGWMRWHDQSAPLPQPKATAKASISKQPAAIATRRFDPAAPPSDMPPLGAGENAECESNFGSNASVAGQMRQTDATHATLTVTQVRLTLQLDITLWVPQDVTEQVLEHEQGHRQISESYYQSADKLAARIADAYMGKQVVITGVDLHEASSKALQQLGAEITDEYNKQLNPDPTQLRFDSITDHSRNEGITARDAVAQVLSETTLASDSPNF